MPLFLGDSRRKIKLNGEDLTLNRYIIDGKVKTIDEYILKDEENVYLTVKEGEK